MARLRAQSFLAHQFGHAMLAAALSGGRQRLMDLAIAVAPTTLVPVLANLAAQAFVFLGPSGGIIPAPGIVAAGMHPQDAT